MPEPVTSPSSPTTPDYAELVRFLVEPFLELPESLKVDCELSQSKLKVWVRLAFESSDKGRVFGRGGRNIQAIRTVLEAAARNVGYSAHLDVFGSQPGRHSEGESEVADKHPPRRSSSSKGSPKLRSRSESPGEL